AGFEFPARGRAVFVRYVEEEVRGRVGEAHVDDLALDRNRHFHVVRGGERMMRERGNRRHEREGCGGKRAWLQGEFHGLLLLWEIWMFDSAAMIGQCL